MQIMYRQTDAFFVRRQICQTAVTNKIAAAHLHDIAAKATELVALEEFYQQLIHGTDQHRCEIHFGSFVLQEF